MQSMHTIVCTSVTTNPQKACPAHTFFFYLNSFINVRDIIITKSDAEYTKFDMNSKAFTVVLNCGFGILMFLMEVI